MLDNPKVKQVAASRSRFPVELVLLGLATLLFVAQITLGTAIEFAMAVFLTFFIVILTLRSIGYGSVGGLMLIIIVSDYLVISQLLKVWLFQAADTNLRAPDTTSFVLLLGISAVCAAAIVVSKLLGNRKVIRFDTSPETLAWVRNISLVLGLFFLVVKRSYGVTAEGEGNYGGIVGIASQLGTIFSFPIVAETWRVLKLSGGRRSTSLWLFAIVGALTLQGFLANSKELTAIPFLMYVVAAATYRGYISRQHLAAVGVALFVGVTILYPMIHILRAARDLNGNVSLSVAADEVERVITDPASFFDEWDNDKMGEALLTDFIHSRSNISAITTISWAVSSSLPTPMASFRR